MLPGKGKNRDWSFYNKRRVSGESFELGLNWIVVIIL
jgi:hypothetical protein